MGRMPAALASAALGMIAVGTVLLASPAYAAYPPKQCSATASATTVVAGGTVTVSGACFVPNSTVTVTLGGQVLATVQANGRGQATATVTIPSGTSPGKYTITLTDSAGDAASVQISVTSAAAAVPVTTSHNGGLPFTGAYIVPMTLAAAVLVLLGAFTLVLMRRRRPGTQAAAGTTSRSDL